MSTKHTPGPFRIGRLAKHGHPIRILAEDKTIAFVPEDDTLETKAGRIVEFCSPEAEANARLIAAAPELLEALSLPIVARALQYVAEDPAEGEGDFLPGEDAEAERALDQICAAIAKAKGETP